MFRSRKRKVSPDKKLEKSKKLKVSSKIFRSPSSTKTNTEAKTKLSKLLPEGYDSIILTANTKPVETFEENEAVFGCVRLPILTKEDAMVWVKKFERKSFTSYRTQKTWKKDVNTGLFKRKYICNVRSKDAAGQGAIATCKGSIIFTIKDQEEIQANPDYYLRDYPSQVIIHFCHNHKIDPDSYMKNLRPSAELRIIFGTYFAKGHSPFSALICHKCDLHSSYGAEFYNVVSNGGICPSYNWCFHEYEKFFMRKFIEPPEDKLNEKLKDTVSQYNAKWRSECAIISHNPLFVLSICTPLMKSIFRSGFAEELITVRCFSTPKTVPKRQKLILFLCHTPIGSLPFGVVVTFAEDTENVSDGIKDLIKMFGVTSYSPKTIITDENALVSKALKRCFPQSQVLFNEFQMLQSIWRIIRVVCTDDDEEFQALYNLFLVTLNSSSEEEFKKNFDSLLVYAEKYPKLTNFLKYFKLRSNSYVLYARPKIEFNTDVLNYTDSGTIILQDVSIKYGNFFNIVQIFDFLSKSYVDHYERKLNKIIEGDLKGFFKTNFYVPLSKIADFTCEKISDTEFLVSLNEMKFFVNAELDTCTCQVGVHGGSCVHQYIVEKNLGLVPECYTPLCDDMLGIFKNILKEKNIKPPIPDSDNLSELGSALDSLKSELDTFSPDPDDFSDIVSSVCCSEISSFSGMPPDMEHLGPIDEIFLVPPDISDSFTDITDEMMSPLVLSEFDDNNEDNEDFLDDSEQYNRESGELEPIESSVSTQEVKHFQNNVLVEVLPTNLEQSIPTSGVFKNEDNTGNVIIYEYTEDDIKCNNEVEIAEQCDTVEGETLVHLPTDGSIILTTDVEGYNITKNVASVVESSVVYSYSSENQDQVEFFEEVMTENDRKTAEIAEFLTNLPDTNNSNYHAPTSTKQEHYSPDVDIIHHLVDENKIVDSLNTNKIHTFSGHLTEINTPIPNEEGSITEQVHQTLSNGVVVVRNEEFFTNYKVLENNVLSIVTETQNALSNIDKDNISNERHYDAIAQQPEQNLITDSYEENSLIMMSPNDLFDDNKNVEPDLSPDKQDMKINVLSSVVIKPPSFTPNFPLNLNAIKHKTLRNVKEDSRLRMSEQRMTQSGNTIFIHDPLKSEPRKIVLPIIIKKNQPNKPRVRSLIEIENMDVDKLNQASEKDVIKLYCNQSAEKTLLDDLDREEYKALKREVISNKIPFNRGSKEEHLVEENTQKLQIQKTVSPELTQPEKFSQESDENISDLVSQDYEKGISGSEGTILAECDPIDSSQELEQDVSDSDIGSQEYDKVMSDSEEIMLAECDPEELAKNDFIEIVEIDSDGLEELATQEFDINLISELPSKPTSSQTLSAQKFPLNVVQLKELPPKILPFKTFSFEGAPSCSNFMPLQDFMSKNSPLKASTDKSIKKELSSPIFKPNKNKLLQEQLTTTFSQLQNLMGRNNFKESVEKFLGKGNEQCTDSNHSSEQKDHTNKSIDQIQSLGNTVTLEPIYKQQTKRFVKKSKNNEKPKLYSNKLDNTKTLKEVTKDTISNETDGKESIPNVKEDNITPFKDLYQIKQKPKKTKGFVSVSQTSADKAQKVLDANKKPMANVCSEESGLSDFEDTGASSEGFSFEIDQSSADESDELQYLSDNDSSADLPEDVDPLGTTDNEHLNRIVQPIPPSRIKSAGKKPKSNKFSAKISKKTEEYIRRNPQSDNNSSDESSGHIGLSDSTSKPRIKGKLPPNSQLEVTSRKIQKTSELSVKTLKKTETFLNPNPQSDDDSSDESTSHVRLSGATNKDDLKGEQPLICQREIKSAVKHQKTNKVSVKPLKKSEESTSENSQPDDNGSDESINQAGISGITSEEHVKSKLPIHLQPELSVKTRKKTEKSVSQNPHYDEHGSDELTELSGIPYKEQVKNRLPAHLQLDRRSSGRNQKGEKVPTRTLKNVSNDESIDMDRSGERYRKDIRDKMSPNISFLEDDLFVTKTKRPVTNKKVKNIHILRKTSDSKILEQPDISFAEIIKNPDLARKDDNNELNICKDVASNVTNIFPIKTNQKLEPKMSNKNKKTNSATTFKLDSLPSILSQPYKQSVPAENKILGFNVNTSFILTNNKATVGHNLASVVTNKTSQNAAKKSTLPKPFDKEHHLGEVKLHNLVVALESESGDGKPMSQMRKDVKDLEAILTSDIDVDRNLGSEINEKYTESNAHTASILKNEDLSFLFDDPRFETVVEDEPLPEPALLAGPFVSATTVKTTNSNVTSGIVAFPIMPLKSGVHKASVCNLGDKDTHIKTTARRVNTKRKCDFIQKDPLEITSELPEKMVKYTDNTNLLNQGIHKIARGAKSNLQLTPYRNTDSNTCHTAGIAQSGKKTIITLMIYTNNSKSKTADSPFRKKLPKSEVNSLEVNTKTLDLVKTKNPKTKLDTRNDNIVQDDTLVAQNWRNDRSESLPVKAEDVLETKIDTSELVRNPTSKKFQKVKSNERQCNLSGTNAQRSDGIDIVQRPKASTSENNEDKLKPRGRKNVINTNEASSNEYRTRRSRFRKESLTKGMTNTLEIKVALENPIIKGTSRESKAVNSSEDSSTLTRERMGTSQKKASCTRESKAKMRNTGLEETTKHHLKTSKAPETMALGLVHGRRNVQQDRALYQEVKESKIQEVNRAKKGISFEGAATKDQNKGLVNLKEDNVSLMPKSKEKMSPKKKIQKDVSMITVIEDKTKYMITRSKSIQRQTSPKKEESARDANVVQKKKIDTIKSVKGQKQTLYKNNADNNSSLVESKTTSWHVTSLEKNTPITSPTGKTLKDSQEKLLLKKETFKTDKGENSIKNVTNKKGIPQSAALEKIVPKVGQGNLLSIKSPGNKNRVHRDFVSASKLIKTSKLSLESLNPSQSPTVDYESDDLENSIVASVLEKQSVSKKNLKQTAIAEEQSIISSTPKKSLGYEDAFKMFLETSNRWGSDKPQGQSILDFDKEVDQSDWESNIGSRRRTKSVSNPKGRIFEDKKLVSGNMKKSVSWADGLNLIEYIKESDNDSDDSEIRTVSKENEFTRGKRKQLGSQHRLRSSSPKKQEKDQSIAVNHSKGVTMSRSQNIHQKRKIASQKDKLRLEEAKRPISSTPIIQASRRSLDRTEKCSLGNRLNRSRSCAPNRANVKTITKKRSKSCTRVENREPKLVVLLERSKKIDRMCQDIRHLTPRTLGCRRGQRIGYKELLHRARLSKEF